ncbi:MAG: hypothetical protein AAF085_13840, partial [Planctomycetota bacterium]
RYVERRVFDETGTHYRVKAYRMEDGPLRKGALLLQINYSERRVIKVIVDEQKRINPLQTEIETRNRGAVRQEGKSELKRQLADAAREAMDEAVLLLVDYLNHQAD